MDAGPAPARSRPRGFALIIVLIIAVAALVATYGIVESSLNSRVAVVRTSHGDLSESIAKAGLERAVAYLEANGAADFDWVLDPNQDADCSSSGFVAGTEAFQPDFTEAGVQKDVEFPPAGGTSERLYTMLPYNGGAYLIRFEDDADDMVDNNESGSWSTWTSNNTGTGDPDCVEGKDDVNTLLGTSNGAENPVRDRNRAIWVEVIGVYPGTDLSNVRYKTVMRKRHTYVPPASVAGIQVKGNINIQGNAGLYACSPVGSLEVEGNVEVHSGAGRLCASGDSIASDFEPNPPSTQINHCTDAAFSGSCRVMPAPGSLDEGSVSVPNPGPIATNPDFYVDWSRPCVFYQGTANADEDPNLAGTLWFWDAEAQRGPGDVPCKDFEGSGATGGKPWPPRPSQADSGSASNPADWAGCWTPLIVDAGAICLPLDINEKDGSLSCGWNPRDTALSPIETAVNTLLLPLGGASPYVFSGGQDFNKPAWGAECSIEYPPYATTQTTFSCSADCAGDSTKCCNGSRTALEWTGTPGQTMFWYPLGANELDELAAVPVGVYIVDTSAQFNPTGAPASFDFGNFPVPAPPTVMSHPGDFPMTGQHRTGNVAGYPMATWVYDVGIRIQTDSWFGVGQGFGNPDDETGASYPSVIIEDGDVELQGGANVAFAGSIYVTTQGMTWAGNGQMSLFGEVHIYAGDWDLTGTGDYEWFYSDALQQPPPDAGGAPLVHRARQ